MTQPVAPHQKPPGTLAAPSGEFEKFVYIVSHDLNEPLRMLSSFLDLMDIKYGKEMPAEMHEYMDYCRENASKMKQMMQALVQLSRVGRNREDITEIELRPLMEDLLTMYSHEISEKQAVVTFDKLPAIRAQWGLIIDLFKILLHNIFENADKTPLNIHISACSEADGKAKISVEDNGRGIKSVYLDSVCEIFRKADSKTPNVGAGLAIAKAIVEKYGGSLEVKSREGRGTVVSFTLPT